MTFLQSPQMHVTEPGELIEAVPYLLGFHPTESLVLIGLHSRGQGRQEVAVALRVDLPEHPPHTEDLVDLVRALSSSDCQTVVCLFFTETMRADARHFGPLAVLSDFAAAELSKAGMELLDALVVSAHRWWSLCCEDVSCCPAYGVPRNLGSTVTAAEATVAGLVALPNRASMLALLSGTSVGEREALAPLIRAATSPAPAERTSRVIALTKAADRLRLTTSAAQTTGAGTRTAGTTDAHLGRITDEQLASYAGWLQDVVVRDAIWLGIDDGSLDATALMQQILTRVPAPFDAPALFLFGWSRWRAGNGTLAAMAAERALESDATYSAARLLLGALQYGLNPRRTPALRMGQPPP